MQTSKLGQENQIMKNDIKMLKECVASLIQVKHDYEFVLLGNWFVGALQEKGFVDAFKIAFPPVGAVEIALYEKSTLQII
jgi:hypothetical protein